MPIEIILIALLLIVAVALWSRRIGGFRSTRCLWRRDPTHKTGARQRYICRRCGVDAFTQNGRAPQNCHRAGRSL